MVRCKINQCQDRFESLERKKVNKWPPEKCGTMQSTWKKDFYQEKRSISYFETREKTLRSSYRSSYIRGIWNSLILWNALDTNIFLFLLSIFLDFIFLFFWISFSFSFFDNEEAHDIAVTWCDIIGLEHGGRIQKMMSGHIYTTW